MVLFIDSTSDTLKLNLRSLRSIPSAGCPHRQGPICSLFQSKHSLTGRLVIALVADSQFRESSHMRELRQSGKSGEEHRRKEAASLVTAH